jgi:type I restriction enzyme M protein
MEYIPELTWMMFMRLLDEKECRQHEEAEMVGEDFEESLGFPYRWRDYAFQDIE